MSVEFDMGRYSIFKSLQVLLFMRLLCLLLFFSTVLNEINGQHQDRNLDNGVPHFMVDFGEGFSEMIRFKEAMGMDTPSDSTYIPSDSAYMPYDIGIPRFSNISLMVGEFSNSVEFDNWYNSYSDGSPINPTTIRIVLVDVDNTPLIEWVLDEAYPIKISGFMTEEWGVLVENIELTYSFMTYIEH